jgi:hypothetical protein
MCLVHPKLEVEYFWPTVLGLMADSLIWTSAGNIFIRGQESGGNEVNSKPVGFRLFQNKVYSPRL